jgi:hypothetical protein
MKTLFLIFLVGMIFTLSTGQSTSSQINYSSLSAGNIVKSTDLTVNNIHGTMNKYTFIKAYLTDNYGKPISNKIITFNIEADPNTYIAVTSNNGHALLYYYIFQKTGVYEIHANYPGDETYSASTGSGKLTVE